METRYQNLTMTQRSDLLKLLQKFEDLFDGTLCTWKTDLLDIKLKEYTNTIRLQPHPVTKVHEEMFKK